MADTGITIQWERGVVLERNINIITDLDGKRFVLIRDIRFKAKKREDWKEVEEYYMQILKAGCP